MQFCVNLKTMVVASIEVEYEYTKINDEGQEEPGARETMLVSFTTKGKNVFYPESINNDAVKAEFVRICKKDDRWFRREMEPRGHKPSYVYGSQRFLAYRLKEVYFVVA